MSNIYSCSYGNCCYEGTAKEMYYFKTIGPAPETKRFCSLACAKESISRELERHGDYKLAKEDKLLARIYKKATA